MSQAAENRKLRIERLERLIEFARKELNYCERDRVMPNAYKPLLKLMIQYGSEERERAKKDLKRILQREEAEVQG